MSCFEEVQAVTQDIVIKLAHTCLDSYANLKAIVWYVLYLILFGRRRIC